MKHIYPSRTGFVTSLETFQGEHVQGLRLQSGGFRDSSWRPPQEVGGGFGNFPGGRQAGAPRPGPGAAARAPGLRGQRSVPLLVCPRPGGVARGTRPNTCGRGQRGTRSRKRKCVPAEPALP